METKLPEWQQPHDHLIATDDDFATMEAPAFAVLQNCTGFRPKPLWPGKMWCCRFRGKWFLARVEADLSVKWREILIA